jgi:hypothetical protein
VTLTSSETIRALSFWALGKFVAGGDSILQPLAGRTFASYFIASKFASSLIEPFLGSRID